MRRAERRLCRPDRRKMRHHSTHSHQHQRPTADAHPPVPGTHSELTSKLSRQDPCAKTSPEGHDRTSNLAVAAKAVLRFAGVWRTDEHRLTRLRRDGAVRARSTGKCATMDLGIGWISSFRPTQHRRKLTVNKSIRATPRNSPAASTSTAVPTTASTVTR
jgi:hypothetical protein